ncbi:hypothetical protein TTHERM_00283710 (macronuclear) [Tetrahymena thermophila SB210]|uniref:Uncharacterized protein n=1 Tax=Tetrahymena thermophila (strain SB210) TaxID=312017 RepID=I7M8F5_TETTS|nr:hypothetical protein TTHERM_00283710 [Tetrahymena thermophila SB210]EAR97982.2 hypothetical protein TTHERM_00283710 [Tetrahymena thermophila SB210]|eukprot:XP_001018227.2 hypothetical protein TTHERM_00283710 [Tetrahymena thermophila SB210]
MSVYNDHNCSKKYYCFCKGCEIALCDKCIDQHEEHQQFIVEKDQLIKQLVESKNKYYTFTEKLITDMKQTLMYAASLFEFDVNYINNMIKLFVDYEDQPQNRKKLTEDIENFLLGSYKSKVSLNEVYIENVNIKSFINPIKESFQSISKNYLEFYKSMRNMELFKINIKNINSKILNKKKSSGIKITDKSELIQQDILKGMRVQDIVEKYNVSSSTVSKYLRLMNRNDEDMKSFKYSDEYKELQNLFKEDDAFEQELLEKKEAENLKLAKASTSGKKKGRKTKKDILESTGKKKVCSDNGSDNNSSDSIKINKKEEKNISKDQNKMIQAQLNELINQYQPQISQQTCSQNIQGSLKQAVLLPKEMNLQLNCSENQNKNLPQSSNQNFTNQTVENSIQNDPCNLQIQDQQPNNNIKSLNDFRVNPLLKLREQADKVKLSNHMLPFYYKQHPSLGITFKNQLNFYSIDGKNSQLGQYKIEHSSIYQDNFIKSICILQSRKMNRDIIFMQSMNNIVFIIDSTTYNMKLLQSGIDCFDFFRGAENDGQIRMGIIAKQGINIVRYTYKVEKDKELDQEWIDKRVLCQVNPVEFLELNKIVLFFSGNTKFLSFLCKNGIFIYKQDKQDLKYNKVDFIQEPGVIFIKPSPKSFKMSNNVKYNLFAASQSQLIMYSATQNICERISLQRANETIKDFVVTYNSKLNKEYVVVSYSRNIIVIVDKQLGKIDVSTESDIKSIQVFWVDTTMQLCYQTVQDDAMKFNIEYFEF